MEWGGSRVFPGGRGVSGSFRGWAARAQGESQKADPGRGLGRDHTSRPARQAKAGARRSPGALGRDGGARALGGEQPRVHRAWTGPPAAGSSQGPGGPVRRGAGGPTHR